MGRPGKGCDTVRFVGGRTAKALAAAFAMLPLFAFLSLDAAAQQTVSPSGPGLIGDYFNFSEGATNSPPFPAGTPATTFPPAGGYPGGPNPVISPELHFLQRLDATVNFPDLTNPASAPGMNADHQCWGAVWYGYLTIPASPTNYDFGIGTDDGGRLWVGQSPLTTTPTVDNWTAFEAIGGNGGNKQTAATMTFTAGQVVPIRFEFWQDGSLVGAQLWWRAQGAGSYSIIPAFTTAGGGLSSPVPCGAPTLTATALAGSQEIDLSWTPSATGETPTAYMVFRSTTPGGEGTTPIAIVTGTTYQDTAVVYGTKYYYKVQPTAFGGLFIGNPSAEVSCSPNPISITPATMNIIENGGIGTITLTISSALPNGATLSIPVSVQNLTSGGPSFVVSSGGSAPGATATVNFTGTGAAGLSQTVTVTGVDDLIANDPQTANINFGTSVSSDPAYSGLTFSPVVCTQVDSDAAGIVVTPNSGLGVTNGGPPIQFFVQLATIPSSNVTVNFSVSISYLATVSGPITFTPGNWNVQQPVTITPLSVNSTTTYVTSFYINFAVSSADVNYNNMAVPPLFIFEPTTTPPLNHVWKCGLLGMESLLPILAAGWWRRRRRSSRK